MKARVEEGCISCGTCVAVCPEVFRFNDDGLAEAYEAIEPEYESAAEEARDSCPVSVITWRIRGKQRNVDTESKN